MRFSVVGNLAQAIVLLQAAHESAIHELTVGYVTGKLKDRVAESGLPLRLASSAEDVLVDAQTDVILVAASDAQESVYLARQASQVDCHVVVLPPKDVSTAFSYELHLLLDESRRGIIVLSGRWYVEPDNEVTNRRASVRQLALSLPIPGSHDASLDHVQLAAIDALCGCGFSYSQVTAIDVRAADDVLLSRTITLGASEVAEAKLPPATLTLTAGQTAEAPAGEIHVALFDGKQGTLRFLAPGNSCDSATGANGFSPTLPDRLTSALTSPEQCQTAMRQFSHSLELLAGIEKSLRRRRTVDVHSDAASERGVFKSQMTAIGCGVLTYVTLGMVVYLLIAQVADLPTWALQTARIIWIAPVVIFLLLQLLLPVARSRNSDQPPANG
ncbi:MAG: hypothetical protein R3C19_13860 [Planctomycetaceae bacterium]